MKEEKTNKIEKGLKSQIVEKMTMLVTAAFGFVAALQWNNWVQAIMKPIIEKGGRSHLWLLLIAIIVTAIAVIITYLFGKISAKIK